MAASVSQPLTVPERFSFSEVAMSTPEFVPYLSVTDAEKAVAYYSRVFEVGPALLLNMPDGRIMHCEFRFGSTRFLLSEELPEPPPNKTCRGT